MTVVGTLAVIDVSEFTVTVGLAYSVPSLPINLTVAPLLKPEPVIARS